MSRADYISSKQLGEDEAIRRASKWLSEGNYTPDDIFHKSKSKPKFDVLPVYLFTATYSAYAHVHGLQPQLVPTIEKDVNGKPYHTQKWKLVPNTEVVEFDTEFMTKVYSGYIKNEAIKKFVEETKWNNDQIYIIDNGGRSLEHNFVNSKEVEWDNVAYKRLHEEAIKLAERKSRDFQKIIYTEIRISNVKKDGYGFLLPFFLFAYVYNGKDYYIIIDANNPDRIAGERPTNNVRILSVVLSRLIIYGLSAWGIKMLCQSQFIDSHEKLFYWSLIVPALLVILIVELTIARYISTWRKRREKVLEGFLNHLDGTQRLTDQTEDES